MPKKKSKGGIKCNSCEYYNKKQDYCEAREIAHCTKQSNTNFSKCQDYLIKENLVMF